MHACLHVYVQQMSVFFLYAKQNKLKKKLIKEFLKKNVLAKSVQFSNASPVASQLFCVSPPGGALPGATEPTVDTVSVQPIPTYWYYVMAGGGALLLLASATLVMVLCCHRYHLAAKKSQHSVAYQSSPYAGGPAPGAGVEPMLTIRLDKEDRSSQC